MKDEDCVQFLQWALPQRQMRWAGFRKVRAQVCKRLDRRLRQLQLHDVHAYQTHLQTHPEEWEVLDALSRVTISRFYRDKLLFQYLGSDVLPELARQALGRGATRLKVWSAGCAGGEEAYSVSLLWLLQLQNDFPTLPIAITATDAGEDMLARARHGCYAYSSIKNLPSSWKEMGFSREQNQYCLKPPYRQPVTFLQQDIRQTTPGQDFDLVLCRNLAFTYFDTPLQCVVLEQIQRAIVPCGVLVLGIHENLPDCAQGFSTWSERLKIYRIGELSGFG